VPLDETISDDGSRYIRPHGLCSDICIAGGKELSDKHAAWQATHIVGKLLHDIDGSLRPGRDLRLEVPNEFKNPLYVIRVVAELPSPDGRNAASMASAS
jgi:hypothetical protein